MPYSIDPYTSSLFTGLGVVCILAGLFFLFRPGAHGAKLELFGMKFESSSAGLLVFLVGVGMLGHPIYTDPEPSVAQAADDALPFAQTVVAREIPGAGTGEAISFEARRAVFLEGTEQEPNESIGGANIVVLGSSVIGVVEPGTSDFFVTFMPDEVKGEIFFNATGNVTLRVYDDVAGLLFDNQKSGSIYGAPDIRGFSKQIEHRSYAVEIANRLRDDNSISRSEKYTLSIAVKPD